MGVVRGGMAPHARPRGAARRSAGRARRAAHRAPLRPSPRRALARTPCGARGCRVGRGAPARPRLHHRRPRLAPLRDAGARGAASRDRPLLRRPRQPRLRGQPRSVLPARRSGARSPLSRTSTLLGDDAVEVELRGRRVQIVGVDPQAYAARSAAPDTLADHAADLRILLCHFPRIVKRIPSVFHLVLAGHLHAGQIVVPYPGGRLRLAHLRARDVEGLYDYGATKLHVSPGLGTTFVPFRLFARPEVTELVVRSA